jgi:hypothetical protein
LAFWGCSVPPSSSGQSTTAHETAQLRYIINKICLPAVRDSVPLRELIASLGLRIDKRCDVLYGCRIWYCSPDANNICVTPPYNRGCWTSIRYDRDFTKLNGIVQAALGSDREKWIVLHPILPRVGYRELFCNQASNTSVTTTGFLPGDVLGYVLGAPGNRSARSYTVVKDAEFDVQIRSLPAPGSCSAE